MSTDQSKEQQREFAETAAIAKFFGFKPSPSPEVIKRDHESVKNLFDSDNLLGLTSIFRTYSEEKKNLPQYACAYFEKPFDGLKKAQRKPDQKINCCLFSIGSAKYVSEALAIEAAIAMLSSIGYKNLEIGINSIGDKDSMNAFQKNLAIFIKKHFNSFPADLRQEIKKNQFVLLGSGLKEDWKKFQKDCPKSIDFLSEASRSHFKEILEFMEVMNIDYSIDHSLLGNHDVGAETVFSIREDSLELAKGLRLNRIAKKIGYKKDVPCVSVDIDAKSKKPIKKIKIKSSRPKFYLVQFGAEARLKSFSVLRELYKTKAAIMHALEKDRLGDQMSFAERSGAPYLILIGQKEALDNSVVIRNTMTRAQEIVSITNLGDRAKELE